MGNALTYYTFSVAAATAREMFILFTSPLGEKTTITFEKC